MKALRYYAQKMPVVSITGPRQSGKSTLARSAFESYRYVTLEDLEIRAFANEDPKGFIATFPWPVIVDEAQYAPKLFSYIQIQSDAENQAGMYVLTGSQDFLLSKNIAQSLAGRVAILHLLPFSMQELSTTQYHANDWECYAWKGLYPRIYDKDLDPAKWYGDYIATYLERDVRDITQIGDIRSFHQFLQLCAGRMGQMVNFSSMGADLGLSYQTIKRWLSILEATNVVWLLPQHYKNFNKRVVKSPKLYFCDPGLGAYLLGLREESDIQRHFAKGPLFENLIISEIIKAFYNRALTPPVYFWRDSAGNEIDCLIDYRGDLYPVEIKSGKTFNPAFLKGLNHYAAISKTPPANSSLIYGGDIRQSREQTAILPWHAVYDLPCLKLVASE